MRQANRGLTCLILFYSAFIMSRVLAATIFVDGSALGPGDGSAGDPFLTIQEGVDAAVDGDVVSVAPGTYQDLTNVQTLPYLGSRAAVVFMEHGVDVIASDPDPANTVIDGQLQVTGVVFSQATSTLSGFTIENGNGGLPGGGGILSVEASPTITNNDIISNDSNLGVGGGIFLTYNSTGTITNNEISYNSAGFGGALGSYLSQVDMAGNTLFGNSSTIAGGAIDIDYTVLTLDADTLAANYTTGSGGGGAIRSWDSRLTISNSTLTSNSTSGTFGEGGALWIGYTDAILDGTNVTYNTSIRGGGGIYTGLSRLEVRGGEISHNTAIDEGGGIYGWYHNNIILDGTTMEDNEATLDRGGAIYTFKGQLKITNSVISGNRSNLRGGAIYEYLGIITVTDSTFYGNFASGGAYYSYYGSGGAIFLYSSKSLIEANQFLGNVAVDGGAIGLLDECQGCQDEYVGNNVITNNLISGNTALSGFGGGILANNLGHLTLNNNTIVNNTAADSGGGLYLARIRYAFLTNNIIEGNQTLTGAPGGGVYYYERSATPNGSPLVVSNNDIFGNSPDNWLGTYTSDPTGSNGNISADPLFVGGGDYRLGGGSPAMDTGDNSVRGIAGPDLDGNPRIADGDEVGGTVIDMGAYEVPFPSPNTPPVARAFSRRAFHGNSPLRLDGTRSFDLDGNPITFLWSQVGGPPAILDDPTSPAPTILDLDPGSFPVDGTYGYDGLPTSLFFDLTVSDGRSSGTTRIEVRSWEDSVGIALDLAGYNFYQEYAGPADVLGLAFSADGSQLVIVTGFGAAGKLYLGPVAREGLTGRITGFGPFSFIDNTQDGISLATHPSGTLFIGTQGGALLQLLPDTRLFSFDLSQFGITSPEGIAFPPAALGNGDGLSMLVAGFSTRQIFEVTLSDNGDGTFTPTSAVMLLDIALLMSNPEGLTYIQTGGVWKLLIIGSNEFKMLDLDQVTGLPSALVLNDAFVDSTFAMRLDGVTRDPLGDAILAVNSSGNDPGDNIVTLHATPLDLDGDGFDDAGDNCVSTPNPAQVDTDFDGIGDLCDNIIPPSSDLALTKTHVGDFVEGSSGDYTLSVSNVGPDQDLGPITVVDTLPVGLSYASFSGTLWSCSPAGQIVTCTYPGAAPVGALPDLTLSVSVTALAGAMLTNTATVTGTNEDFNPTNSTANDLTNIVTSGGGDLPPVADAGASQTVSEGVLVTLDGSGSFDPEGQPLTYAWTQTVGPSAPLSDATAVAPTFTAPDVTATTELRYRLIVDDGTAAPSAPNTVIITVLDVAADLPPVADAGANRRGVPGATVTLDGSASLDPERNPLTYSWVQTGGPGVPLSDPSIAGPTVDLTGLSPFDLLTYELIVDDGTAGPSAPDTVGVQVVPVPEWSQWRHDAENSGLTSSQGPTVGGSAFNITLPAGVRSSVSFGQDALYVGADDGKLYAFALDGTPLWDFATGGSVRTTPLVLPDGTIVFGSFDGNLYAVDSGGTPLSGWPFSAGGKFRFSSPAYYASANLIVAGSEDGKLYAINLATGLEQLQVQTGGAVHSSPAIASGVAYFGSTDGQLRAVDLGSGSVLWTTDLGAGVQSAPALDLSMGYLYVGTDDGKVRAVSMSDGSVSWTFQAGGAVTSSPAIDPVFGQIYFGSDDFHLYAVDRFSGQELWRHLTGSYVRSSPSVDSAGMVFVGSCDGNVYSLDYDGFEVFTFASSGLIIPSPTIGNDGLLYIGSDDRFVHAIGPDPFGALPAPAMAPRLDEMTPFSGIQGDTLEVTLRGKDLSADLSFDLGVGVRVTGQQLISPEEMQLTISLEAAAEVGSRDVLADRSTGFLSSCVDGFQVEFDCRRSDITGDDMVDGLDLASLAARFGQETESAISADLNGDGRIDGDDLSLLGARFGGDASSCR